MELPTQDPEKAKEKEWVRAKVLWMRTTMEFVTMPEVDREPVRDRALAKVAVVARVRARVRLANTINKPLFFLEKGFVPKL